MFAMMTMVAGMLATILVLLVASPPFTCFLQQLVFILSWNPPFSKTKKNEKIHRSETANSRALWFSPKCVELFQMPSWAISVWCVITEKHKKNLENTNLHQRIKKAQCPENYWSFLNQALAKTEKIYFSAELKKLKNIFWFFFPISTPLQKLRKFKRFLRSFKRKSTYLYLNPFNNECLRWQSFPRITWGTGWTSTIGLSARSMCLQ